MLLTTDLLSCQDAPDGRQDAAEAGRLGQESITPGGAAMPNWGSSPLNPIQYCKKKGEREGESLQTLLIKACTIFCLPKSRQSLSLLQDILGLAGTAAWMGGVAHLGPAAVGTRRGTVLLAWLLPFSSLSAGSIPPLFFNVFSFAGEKV